MADKLNVLGERCRSLLSKGLYINQCYDVGRIENPAVKGRRLLATDGE